MICPAAIRSDLRVRVARPVAPATFPALRVSRAQKYANTGFEVLATYRSEIHSGWPAWTTGQMVDTPAIVTSSFGGGRVLLSSPHPEMTNPLLYDLIVGYVRWAARVI